MFLMDFGSQDANGAAKVLRACMLMGVFNLDDGVIIKHGITSGANSVHFYDLLLEGASCM